MPEEVVAMDDNMLEAIENLRTKYNLLPAEDVIETLLSAAIEQERKPGEGKQ